MSVVFLPGSHDRTGTTQFQRSYRLRAIISHEGYDPNRLRNDIAVLQLEASIDSSLQVNVVCLPNAGNRVEPGKMCYITGTHTLLYEFFHLHNKFHDISSCNRIRNLRFLY